MDRLRAPLSLPQFRHQAKCLRPPFAPLPFDRPRICPSQPGGRGDGDLLPSCWFSIDSEDLNRLHYKLQRQISRRRSLTRANCPLGEQNPRRAKIMEKYQRLRGGIRRALSDHQILFMDLRKDVEQEIQPKREAGKASKRVSFSSPSPANQSPGKAASDWPSLRQLARNKSTASLQLECSSPQKEGGLANQPSKPILTRKISSSHQPQPPIVGGAFRQRTGTMASTGNCEQELAICAMDYAMFRAWRRGSRLSIDVLNNAAVCQSELEEVAKCSAKQQGVRGGVGLANWVGLLKRLLADCLQQRRPTADLATLRARN